MRGMTCARPSCENHAGTAKHGLCRKHAAYLGVQNPMIPAGTAQTTVRTLMGWGCTATAIADAVGASSETIYSLAHDRHQFVRADVDHGLQRLADSGEWEAIAVVPLWRARRRVRSLRAAGWRSADIAQALGVSKTLVSRLATGDAKKAVSADLFARLDALYRAHEHDSVSEQSHLTKQHQWVTPLWWDDIDNPNERPGETHCKGCHGRRIDTMGQCRKCYERRWKQRRGRAKARGKAA